MKGRSLYLIHVVTQRILRPGMLRTLVRTLMGPEKAPVFELVVSQTHSRLQISFELPFSIPAGLELHVPYLNLSV